MSEEQEIQTPEAPVVEQSQPVQGESKSYFSSDGGWNRDAFGEELGAHSIFDKYKTPEELVKGTINQSGLVGKKAEEFWTSDDPETASLRNKVMGVPNDASEYSWDLGEMPEEISSKLNARYEGFREVFKENGVPKSIAEKLIQADAQATINSLEQQAIAEASHREQVEAELRKEWAGDKYDVNIGKAAATLEHLGLGEWANNPAFGNNPQFIKDVVEKLVPLVSNDKLIESKMTENFTDINEEWELSFDKLQGMDKGTPEYERELKHFNKVQERLYSRNNQ